MRPPIYDLYQMKVDRLPQGARSAWLRTLPDQPPPAIDDWVFVGKERHPSKWTIAEMNEKGSCYREIASWTGSSTRTETPAPAKPAHQGLWLLGDLHIQFRNALVGRALAAVPAFDRDGPVSLGAVENRDQPDLGSASLTAPFLRGETEVSMAKFALGRLIETGKSSYPVRLRWRRRHRHA